MKQVLGNSCHFNFAQEPVHILQGELGLPGGDVCMFQVDFIDCLSYEFYEFLYIMTVYNDFENI